MQGLQSLQLFLAVDLPKVEDLYHEPPEFPNCSMWAAPDPFYKKYYSTKGSYYIKWTAYKEINKSLSFLNEEYITRSVYSTNQNKIIYYHRFEHLKMILNIRSNT